jgi:transposase-like protein
MPGKQKRDKNEKNLTRLQSKIAGNVLKPHFDPKFGERQWDESAKRQLVEAVNREFAAQAQDAVYTVRKLEDWVSNAIYRWRKQQQREAAAADAAAAAAPDPARAGGTVAPPPAASTFHPAPVAPVQSATFYPAPEAAVGRPPARKRERVLSNITMKPLQKQVRGEVPSGE